MNIGKMIKEAREAKHLTQEQLAKQLFTTQQAVSKWENGTAYPNLESCKRLSEELGIRISDLITGRKTMNYKNESCFNTLDTIKKLEDISADVLEEHSIEAKYGYEVAVLCKWTLILIIGDLWQNNYRSVNELLDWWDISDQLKCFMSGDININNWCDDINSFIALARNDDDYNDYHDTLKDMMEDLDEDEKQNLAALYDLDNFNLLKYCEGVVQYANMLERSLVTTSDVYAKMRVALNEIILHFDSDRPDDYVSSYTA